MMFDRRGVSFESPRADRAAGPAGQMGLMCAGTRGRASTRLCAVPLGPEPVVRVTVCSARQPEPRSAAGSPAGPLAGLVAKAKL